MRFCRIFPILILIGMALSLMGCSQQKQTNVGLGVEFNTHATPVWIALNDGALERAGINVSKVFKFRTGLELAAAMARGDVDVGWACLGPALLIIDKGIPVKIVGKVHNHGYAIVVNPNKIKDVGDLNGSTVYSPGKGSPCYLLLLKIEDKYGIRCKKAFMTPMNILSALVSGQIDAAALPEHYASVAEERGLRVLVRSQDIWPNMPGSFIVVREELLKKDPELVKKLIEITDDGIEKIKENPDLAAKVDSKELGISENTAMKSISRLEWNTSINSTKIQEYIDFMYQHGILHKKLDATEIIEKL